MKLTFRNFNAKKPLIAGAIAFSSFTCLLSGCDKSYETRADAEFLVTSTIKKVRKLDDCRSLGEKAPHLCDKEYDPLKHCNATCDSGLEIKECTDACDFINNELIVPRARGKTEAMEIIGTMTPKEVIEIITDASLRIDEIGRHYTLLYGLGVFVVLCFVKLISRIRMEGSKTRAVLRLGEKITKPERTAHEE